MNYFISVLVIAVSTLVLGSALALEEEAQQPQPVDCTESELHRQFDFWIGDWDVYIGGKKTLARQKVTLKENGCLIQENWSGISTGQSMNFVDPRSRKWRQVWVDARGGLVEYEGGFEDGAMRMSGHWIFGDGTIDLAEVSWTPLEDGGVRHHIRHSRDNGETWSDFFLAVYRPHQADDAAPEPAETEE